jgi:hypothetical protein
MSKQDYIKFAKMIKGQVNAVQSMRSGEIMNASNPIFHDGYSVAIFNTAHNMADIFAEDNPNFDRDRFLKACGVQS